MIVTEQNSPEVVYLSDHSDTQKHTAANSTINKCRYGPTWEKSVSTLIIAALVCPAGEPVLLLGSLLEPYMDRQERHMETDTHSYFHLIMHHLA